MESQQKQGCLICGKKTPLNRGLCSTHHSRYYKEVRELTDEQKAVYDQTLIQRGLLLPLQKPGPKVKENPFAAVAMELFAAEPKQDYESEPEEAAPQEEGSGRAKPAKPSATKKRGGNRKKKS